MVSRVTTQAVANQSITLAKIANTASLSGPRIANVQIANSTWGVINDTAVSTDTGGYVIINGAGFDNGCAVRVGTGSTTSVTFVNDTTLRVQVPSKTAGTYVMYVINPNGSVAVGVNAITYSGLASWVTQSSLSNFYYSQAVNFNFQATGAVSYSVQAGSFLPPNTSLAANGLLTGYTPGTSNTLYSFILVATDSESQDNPRTFTVFYTTLAPTDPYYNNLILNISGDGTSSSDNSNNFLDLSSSNTLVYANGTGNNLFYSINSPFSPSGWSSYFSGDSTALIVSNTANLALQSSDFTIEFFANRDIQTSNSTLLLWNAIDSASSFGAVRIGVSTSNTFEWLISNTGSSWQANTSNGNFSYNSWSHVALSRSGTTYYGHVNGTKVFESTVLGNLYNGPINRIGASGNNSTLTENYKGLISNMRITKGNSLYGTSNFTSPNNRDFYTTGTNTVFFALNQSYHVDKSAANNSITKIFSSASMRTATVPTSPFPANTGWSANTHGGSIRVTAANTDTHYDYVIANTANSTYTLSGAFTIEGWYYFEGPLYSFIAMLEYGRSSDGLMINFNTSSVEKTLNISSSPGFYARTLDTNYTFNEWVHFAVVRDSSNVLSYFENGVRLYTNTHSVVLNNTPNQSTFLGRTTASDQEARAWMHGVRVIKGQALYDPTQTTLTVPTSIFTPTSNTILLVNFANSSFVSYEPTSSIRAIGNVTISTADKKVGGSSLAFANGGHIRIGGNNYLATLGRRDYTLETWCKLDAVANTVIFDFTGNTTPSNSLIALNIDVLSSGASNVRVLCNNSVIIQNSASKGTGSDWFHLAISKENDLIRLFIDGVQAGSNTNSVDVSLFNSTSTIGIKSTGNTSAGINPFTGKLDNIKYYRGVCLYNNTFTPNTENIGLK